MITSFVPLVAFSAMQVASGPVDTTVCDVIANPRAFDGKLVHFRAGVATAFIHGVYLIDRECAGSIQLASLDAVPADEAKAFDEAVGTEMNGGFDRTAVGTFTGRISWKPDSEGAVHYNPLNLNPQRIRQIEVQRKWPL